WGRSSNVFLSNGSRLYLDVGSHHEYATAECDDLAQLVTPDKAGERILEDLLIDAERRLAEGGIGGDIFLFKNNTDSAGNSYGCHEPGLVGVHDRVVVPGTTVRHDHLATVFLRHISTVSSRTRDPNRLMPHVQTQCHVPGDGRD